MTLPTWARKSLMFAAGIAFTSQFFIVWCDLVYNCGCTFEFWGGAAHCNIQEHGPPDCPWCANSTYGGIAFFTTIVAQAWAAFRPGSGGWAQFASVLAASPIAAGAAGIVIGLWSGYWLG